MPGTFCEGDQINAWPILHVPRRIRIRAGVGEDPRLPIRNRGVAGRDRRRRRIRIRGGDRSEQKEPSENGENPTGFHLASVASEEDESSAKE